MSKSIAGTTVLVHLETPTGLVLKGTVNSWSADSTADRYAVGCELTDLSTGTVYKNNGTTAVPSWQSVDQIATSEIADAAITFPKISIGSEARTATADGTGTGAITAPTAFRTFVAVTSASATNQIALPAITSAGIGQEIWLTVGANGFELITPASSNNTINQVDSDGTNQLDVAANTTVRCTQVSATGWIAETIAATTIAVTAPDND